MESKDFNGLCLEGIFIPENIQVDNEFILKISGEYYKVDLYGDCCSYTYLSDIIKNISLKEYPSKTVKYKIISCKDIDLEEGEYKPRNSRQDVDEVYGLKFLLESNLDEPNSITFIYRNSSNGYYGGGYKISKYTGIIENDFWNYPEGYILVSEDYSNPY